MVEILTKITAILTTVVITIAGWLGFQQPVQAPLGATIPKVVAVFETSLASKITSSATSMTLVSGTDKAGNPLSGYICFVLDEGTASEEFVCGTASSTSVTGMIRGIDPVDGDLEVASLKKEHRRGASVKVTNYPQLAILSRILNGDETLPNALEYATSVSTSTLAGNNQYLASVDYVNSVSYSGAPDADEDTKGIVEQATRSELGSGVSSGDTSAPLFVPNQYFSTSSSATTSVVVTKSNGKINQNFWDLTEDFTWSGEHTFSATATFSGDTAFSGTSTFSGLAKISTGGILTLTAGETIDVSSAPVAVYVKSDDGKVYKTDADYTTTTYYFIGFAIRDCSSGDDCIVQTSGIVDNFSGLTTSTVYYVSSTAGVISTSPGSYAQIVGLAVSESRLLIIGNPYGGKETYASDTLRHSNDSLQQTNNSTPTKIKEIKVNRFLKGVRVKYNYRGDTGGAVTTYNFRLYKNGVAVGAERSTNDNSWLTSSDDITDVVPGDLLQVYAWYSSGSQNYAQVENFRLYYDEKLVPVVDMVNQDP